MPGTALVDAPLDGPEGPTWLISEIGGDFTLLGFGDTELPQIEGIGRVGIGGDHAYRCLTDTEGHATRRFGTDHIYLIRPDAHICAVFHHADVDAIKAAHDRARGIAS